MPGRSNVRFFHQNTKENKTPNIINEEENLNIPLHEACEKGQLEKAKSLIAKGANVSSIVDDTGLPPLHKAVKNGHILIISLLYETKISVLSEVDRHGRFPIHHAVETKKIHIIKAVIRCYKLCNIDVFNHEDNLGRNAIYYATEKGNLETLTCLLEDEYVLDNNSIKEINADYTGKTPLELAEEKNFVAISDYIRSRTVIVEEPRYIMPPLHRAAATNDMETLEHLFINKHINVDEKDGYGRTALHWAIYHGYFDTVIFLIRKGAQINIKDNFHETPLHLIMQKGDFVDILKYLIHLDAISLLDKEDKEKFFNSTMIYCRTGMARCLSTSYPEFFTFKNSEGCTAFHTVAEQQDEIMLRVLLEGEKSGVVKKRNLARALQASSSSGRIGPIKATIKRQVVRKSIGEKCLNEKTALWYAAQRLVGSQYESECQQSFRMFVSLLDYSGDEFDFSTPINNLLKSFYFLGIMLCNLTFSQLEIDFRAKKYFLNTNSQLQDNESELKALLLLHSVITTTIFSVGNARYYEKSCLHKNIREFFFVELEIINGLYNLNYKLLSKKLLTTFIKNIVTVLKGDVYKTLSEQFIDEFGQTLTLLYGASYSQNDLESLQDAYASYFSGESEEKILESLSKITRHTYRDKTTPQSILLEYALGHSLTVLPEPTESLVLPEMSFEIEISFSSFGR